MADTPLWSTELDLSQSKIDNFRLKMLEIRCIEIVYFGHVTINLPDFP